MWNWRERESMCECVSCQKSIFDSRTEGCKTFDRVREGASVWVLWEVDRIKHMWDWLGETSGRQRKPGEGTYRPHTACRSDPWEGEAERRTLNRAVSGQSQGTSRQSCPLATPGSLERSCVCCAAVRSLREVPLEETGRCRGLPVNHTGCSGSKNPTFPALQQWTTSSATLCVFGRTVSVQCTCREEIFKKKKNQTEDTICELFDFIKIIFLLPKS